MKQGVRGYLFMWTCFEMARELIFVVVLLWFYLFITNSRSTRIGVGAVFVYIVIPRGIIKFRLLGRGVGDEEFLCYKQVRLELFI